MDKSRVKEILIKAKSIDEKERERFPVRCRGAYISLKRRIKSLGKGVLFDNFYLIEEAYSAAKGVRISKKLGYYTGILFPLMSTETVGDDLAAFFDVLSDDLDSDECERVKEALFVHCIISLNKGDMESPELIRSLQIFDLTPFMLGFVKYEQILRRDSVYCQLDKETRALYKEKIKIYSKKRGLTFTEGCQRLVEDAIRQKSHIGELLPLQKGEKGWLFLPVIIFAFLEWVLFSVLYKVVPIPIVSLVSLVAMIPLWQTSFDLFVPIVARFRKSEILPRIDMPRITPDRTVLSVIAALGTSVSDVNGLFDNLETLSLKTRSRGKDDSVFWGLLMDLPEGKNAIEAEDAKIIKAAQSCVDRLNSVYPHRFVLFTRDRVYNEKDGIYTSHERKRGAITQLVKYLEGQENELKVYGAKPSNVKYVLTLDADTDMELGALNKMVGTMEHPLNRPEVGERRGVKVVTKGFGILQPALVSTIESVHKTRFSTLMSGVGGVDAYHSSIFNLNSVLFGRGVFCGKGMFDVSVFSKTLTDAFPDGIVLSHDVLEGTRLRAGYMSDVCFFDSVPSNAISFYKRAHRWARGDVQSLSFTGATVRTKTSKAKNPMLSSERFLLFMNVVGLAVPVFQVIGLLFLMWYGIEKITLASFFFLLPSFTPLLNEILRASFCGSLRNVVRRFFGDTLTGLCRESIMLGYRLSSLAFTAYLNADAVIRSVWRMKVSGKKLLEWTTAGQSEGVKNRLLYTFTFTFPSFAAGVFVLLFAKLSLCKLLGILWCLFFLFIYNLGRPVPHTAIPERVKNKLLLYAGDIWGYFDRYVDSTNNYLPPDNVSVFPTSEVAYRTSPTNIGLYLLSVLAASDLSFISPQDAVSRIEQTVKTVEKLPKYRGQLYNWYSTVTLEVIGQEYISTVDCGNFVTSLVALYEGLAEYEKKDKRVSELRRRIKEIEINSDFHFLFDSSRDLFSLGFFADTEKRDSIVYDMYMSEARTTDYYAVARGIVRSSHWSALSRPLIPSALGVGVLSWSGTAFEYFMPQLLLPTYKNSFAHEALSYAFSEQVRFSSYVSGERLFGTSESGYFAFDESLNYQYRAFGVPSLSRRIEGESQRVISPYSSFLMLRANVGQVMRNLESLKRIGMQGEFGFYEALDLCPSRVGNSPSAVKSYMSHHLGMSLVACANCILDDIFTKRFMSDPQMKAVSELLKEAVPADAVGIKREKMDRPVQKKKYITSVKGEAVFRTDASTHAMTGREATAVLFERGLVSLDLLRKGESIAALRPVSKTNSCGLFLFCREGDRVYSPTTSSDVSYAFDGGYAEYKQGPFRAVISFSSRVAATRIRLEASGEKGDVGMYFEPLLISIGAYSAHPAFSKLFFSAELNGSALILTRIGEHPYSLAVMSNVPFGFEISREKLFEGDEYGFDALERACKKSLSSCVSDLSLSPCVFVKNSFEAKTDTTYVIGWGRTRSEALANAREELNTPYSRSIRQSRELFISAVTASGGEYDRNISQLMLSALRPSVKNVYRSQLPPVYGKDAVYALGLSGELPVFLVEESVERKELEAILKCHKLHYIMGVRCDLLIAVRDLGYSRGGMAEIRGMIEDMQCSFLVDKRGGIHFADLNSVPEAMVLSLADSSYPDKKRIGKFPARYLISDPQPCNAEEGGILIREKPDILWSHVIASPTFGTILSHRSLGNTWAYNSCLFRLTHWENDSVGGAYSEKLILEKDGIQRDLCSSADAVRFSHGAAEYVGRHFNIKVAIHPTLMFKTVSVTVENEDFSLIYRFIPVLGNTVSHSCKVEYFSDSKNSVRFRNLFTDGDKKGFGYLMLPFEKEMTISDGDLRAACERGGEVVFVLGYAGSEAHYSAVREYFSTHRFSDVYHLSKTNIEKLLINEKMPMIAYQTLVCRFWARSGPYQSGGAWGFRDQAQDCITLLDISPKTVAAHIARMSAHQYKEGDVQHWWHKGRGVRTHCSDDLLWLVWLASVYILRTHDKSVLCVETSYLCSKELSPNDKDRYEAPERTKEKYPLSHHLKMALDLFVKRGLGDHGLPLILGGDWNDGMNMLPHGSESVWLAFFARIVIHLYARATGDGSYNEFSQLLRKGIEESAFFSDRYARAFLPDGTVLGVEGSRYFEIDALPQAFASICHSITGDGNTSRITLALDSAWRELYDKENGIFRLFAPPLSSFDKNIGYLSAYPQGVRENGGQYTHGAVWAAMGFLYAPSDRDKNVKRAELLANDIDPSTHPEDIYKAEPYVLAGDVYTNGHAGWSWYTGSAAWYRELLLRLSDENRNNSAPLT